MRCLLRPDLRLCLQTRVCCNAANIEKVIVIFSKRMINIFKNDFFHTSLYCISTLLSIFKGTSRKVVIDIMTQTVNMAVVNMNTVFI